MTTFELEPSNACFNEFNHLLILTESLAVAASWQSQRNVCFQPGDVIALECRHLAGSVVHLPLFGPVATAMSDKLPSIIQVSLKKTSSTPVYSTWTGGLSGTIEAVFQPFFVNFYERNAAEISSKFGKIDLCGPPVWQMAWVIRNALSHNGCIHFSKPNHKPVSWRGLTLAPSDNGKKLFHNLISAGDLVVMMLEMEEQRSGCSLKKVIQQ